MVDIGTADLAVLVLTIKIGVSAAFAAFCRALPPTELGGTKVDTGIVLDITTAEAAADAVYCKTSPLLPPG